MEGKAWEASPAHERPVFLRGRCWGEDSAWGSSSPSTELS